MVNYRLELLYFICRLLHFSSLWPMTTCSPIDFNRIPKPMPFHLVAPADQSIIFVDNNYSFLSSSAWEHLIIFHIVYSIIFLFFSFFFMAKRQLISYNLMIFQLNSINRNMIDVITYSSIES